MTKALNGDTFAGRQYKFGAWTGRTDCYSPKDEISSHRLRLWAQSFSDSTQWLLRQLEVFNVS